MAERSIGWHREMARRAINAAAGQARSRYVTDLAGQEGIYATKATQARAYRASVVLGVPTAQPGSYLAAEATAKGCTALALADAIIAKADAWDSQQGPAIEAERMRGLAAVAAATTQAGIAEAVSAAEAALRDA